MPVTEEGQISIDFLLGISIFLLTLGFLIQFIPSLFLSTSEEGSLNSVAYRTANILTEDPGWWENNTHNGTDWEDNLGKLSRIGLANDKTPRTKQTKTPNILSQAKIKRIQNASEINETMFTFYLGLYDKIDGTQIDYGYNITIQPNNEIWLLNNSTLSRGEKIPKSQNVFKITRNVLVETGTLSSFRADELTKNSSEDSVEINISSQTEDVVIQITDFDITLPNAAFYNLTMNGSLLNINSDYKVYKRTNTGGFVPYYNDALNSTDSLLLKINHTLFPNNSTHQLELKFTQMNFTLPGPPFTEYTANAEPFYEPASLVVMVWK